MLAGDGLQPRHQKSMLVTKVAEIKSELTNVRPARQPMSTSFLSKQCISCKMTYKMTHVSSNWPFVMFAVCCYPRLCRILRYFQSSMLLNVVLPSLWQAATRMTNQATYPDSSGQSNGTRILLGTEANCVCVMFFIKYFKIWMCNRWSPPH